MNRRGCGVTAKLWHSASVAEEALEDGRGPRQLPRRPHPPASMPRYSMRLIQRIRKVTGKRPLVRDVGYCVPFAPATSTRLKIPPEYRNPCWLLLASA